MDLLALLVLLVLKDIWRNRNNWIYWKNGITETGVTGQLELFNMDTGPTGQLENRNC